MDTAEIDDQVNVIEIGPDIGVLTEFLTERAAEVMAFEIDYRLVPILADTLRDFDNVIVVNEDILKVDLAAEMGVTRMNIVGFDKKIERALELADEYEQLYATIDWHPTEAGTYTDEVEAYLLEKLKHPKVCCLGGD